MQDSKKVLKPWWFSFSSILTGDGISYSGKTGTYFQLSVVYMCINIKIFNLGDNFIKKDKQIVLREVFCSYHVNLHDCVVVSAIRTEFLSQSELKFNWFTFFTLFSLNIFLKKSPKITFLIITSHICWIFCFWT